MLSNQEKQILKLDGLFTFSTAFANIFLNIYIFKLGGFVSVATYNLVLFFVLYILIVYSGKLLKKYSSNKLIQYSFIAFTLQYLFLFLLQENSIHNLYLIAILGGIGNGLFWPGHNLSQYIATHEKSRNKYFGVLGFITSIASGAGPLLGGLLISIIASASNINYGYMLLFLLTAILMFFLYLIAEKLPSYSGIAFSMSDIFQHKRKKAWNIILIQQFLFGLFDATFSTFSGILIFLIIKGEFQLGLVNSTITLIYAATSLLAGKFLQKNKNAYTLGIIFPSVGLFLFAAQQNWLGIAFLLLIYNAFYPFINIATSKAIYDVMDHSSEPWQKKYHFLIERDTVLGIGRILSYIILLFLFSQGSQLHVAKTWLFVIPIFPFLIGLLQWVQRRRR